MEQSDSYAHVDLNEDLAVTYFNYYAFYIDFMCDLYAAIVENSSLNELLDGAEDTLAELEVPAQISKKFHELIVLLKKAAKNGITHHSVLSAIKSTSSMNFYPLSKKKAIQSDFDESLLTVYPVAFLQSRAPIESFEEFNELVEPLRNIIDSMESSSWFSDEIMDCLNEEVDSAIDEWQENYLDPEAGENEVSDGEDIVKKRPPFISLLCTRRAIEK